MAVCAWPIVRVMLKYAICKLSGCQIHSLILLIRRKMPTPGMAPVIQGFSLTIETFLAFFRKCPLQTPSASLRSSRHRHRRSASLQTQSPHPQCRCRTALRLCHIGSLSPKHPTKIGPQPERSNDGRFL